MYSVELFKHKVSSFIYYLQAKRYVSPWKRHSLRSLNVGIHSGAILILNYNMNHTPLGCSKLAIIELDYGIQLNLSCILPRLSSILVCFDIRTVAVPL